MITRRRILARIVASLASPSAIADAVAQSRPPIDAVFFYGQSNAGAGGHAAPILTQPVSQKTMFSFEGAQQTYASHPVDGKRLRGMGAVRDDLRYAPFPATAMAYAISRRTAGPAHFMHTVWRGGEPLASFLRGSVAWDDLMIAAERMRAATEARGYVPRIAALVLIQGESGPAARESYANMLDALLTDALPALQIKTRQAKPPIAIVLQTNASAAAPQLALETPLAQWDVARRRPNEVALAGPMYQFPLSDGVHQSAVGRMMLGDLLALVLESCRQQKKVWFEPLHPLWARRSDNVIRIGFKLPEKAASLAFDDDWTPAAPDFGFSLDAGGRPIPIQSVALANRSELHIKLAETPRAQQLRVSYAMGQAEKPGWTGGRGQLTAPTSVASAFADMGLGIPPTISHYCIRFRMSVD